MDQIIAFAHVASCTNGGLRWFFANPRLTALTLWQMHVSLSIATGMRRFAHRPGILQLRARPSTNSAQEACGTQETWMRQLATLRSRNHRLSLIRISTLIRIAIHGRGYVEVAVAGDNCAVGVCGRAFERSVDHRVRTTRRGAAVDVVADRARRTRPGEVYGVLLWRRSCAGHRLHGGRVRGVARE